MFDRDDKRRPRSIRFHDSTWEMVEGFAKTERTTASTLIIDATEAVVFDFVRCFRCQEAVPVTFGDLDGRPLREWIAAAQKAVVLQKCVKGKTGGGKTSAHTPVTVGVQRRSQPPSVSGTAGEAATREQDAQERTEPQEAVPVLVAANSASATTVAQLRESVPGVVTASEIAGPAAVFRSFDPADAPHTPPAVPVPPVPDRAKRGLKAKCSHVVAAGTRCKICEPAR